MEAGGQGRWTEAEPMGLITHQERPEVVGRRQELWDKKNMASF